MSAEPRPSGYEGNRLWTEHPGRGRATWILIHRYATDVAAVVTARFEVELLDAEAHRSPTTLAKVDEALQASVAFGDRREPDEAWIVTIPGIGRAPYDDAPYWGFQLCNYWFEPLDYGLTWATRRSAPRAASQHHYR